MLTQIFSYDFMVRALIAGIFVSLSSALLGVCLVLKRYSMIGDGLSHVSFGAYALAFALGVAPIKLAVPIVIVSAFLLLRLRENSKVKADSAIALISTGSLAVGVMATSLSGGMNIDIMGYMFGSILTVGKTEMITSALLSGIIVMLFVGCYNKIFSVTFDESFAAATGINTGFYNKLIAILTALVIVIGKEIMGTMLISALLVFPPLTSMRIFSDFRKVVISSAAVSVGCFIIGLLLSFYFSLPAGASIVSANIAMFLIFSAIEKILKKFYYNN